MVNTPVNFDVVEIVLFGLVHVSTPAMGVDSRATLHYLLALALAHGIQVPSQCIFDWTGPIGI